MRPPATLAPGLPALRLAVLTTALLLGACGGGGDAEPVAPDGNADFAAAQDAAAGAEGAAPDAARPSPRATCGVAGLAEQALQRLNAVRASGADCGSRGRFAATTPLAWNPMLDAAAAGHSADMAARDYFSHTSPDGTTAADRIAAEGYVARTWAENIAAGYASVDAVVDGWLGSDGHCANLMHPAMRDFGLACVAAGAASYPTYWTLNLAAPR